MKRTQLLLVLVGMLVVGLAMGACSSKKMMQLDTATKQAQRTV